MRRVAWDEAVLPSGLNDGLIVAWRKCSDRVYEIQFADERDTVFTVRLCLPWDYPFHAPQGFWVGEAPRHPFYWWDAADDGRPTRVTNLANSRFGLFHERWSPVETMLSYVLRLQCSLTAGGAGDMDYMEAVPLTS